jgi:hypothetical protein
MPKPDGQELSLRPGSSDGGGQDQERRLEERRQHEAQEEEQPGLVGRDPLTEHVRESNGDPSCPDPPHRHERPERGSEYVGWRGDRPTDQSGEGSGPPPRLGGPSPARIADEACDQDPDQRPQQRDQEPYHPANAAPDQPDPDCAASFLSLLHYRILALPKTGVRVRSPAEALLVDLPPAHELGPAARDREDGYDPSLRAAVLAGRGNLERRLFVIVVDGDGVPVHLLQAKLSED